MANMWKALRSPWKSRKVAPDIVQDEEAAAPEKGASLKTQKPISAPEGAPPTYRFPAAAPCNSQLCKCAPSFQTFFFEQGKECRRRSGQGSMQQAAHTLPHYPEVLDAACMLPAARAHTL